MVSYTSNRPAGALGRKSVRPVHAFYNLFALWRSRRELDRLDAARLKDIGLSGAEAGKEARRPIWDVPDGWRG